MIDGTKAMRQSTKSCTVIKSILLSAIIMIALSLLSLSIGAASSISLDSPIFKYIRLPRTLAPILSGAALALSGYIIQRILNNPLSSPNIIGVNSGAGLMAAIATVFIPGSAFALSASSFIGAFAATLLIYMLSQKTGSSRTTIILSGVALNSIFNAFSDIIATIAPESIYATNSFRIGGFQAITLERLFVPSILIGLSILALLLLSRELEILSLGRAEAKSVGLNSDKYNLILLSIASLLASSAVSFSGLIGFVGLVIPHIIRKRFKTFSIQAQIILTAILGAGFTLAADTVARTLFIPYEIPVGIIISLIGGPFFIYILFETKGGHRHANR